MATIFDRQSFMEVTGRIIDWREANSLGVAPISASCLYSHDEMPMLLAFCAQHPDFHVISAMSRYVMVNRYEPEARLYMLGNGNSDPNIVCLHNDRREINLSDALKIAGG